MGTTDDHDPTETQLDRAEEERGVWLSHQTLHDIRNEIQAIRLGVMLLEGGRLSESDCQQTYGDVKLAIDQLLTLADAEGA